MTRQRHGAAQSGDLVSRCSRATVDALVQPAVHLSEAIKEFSLTAALSATGWSSRAVAHEDKMHIRPIAVEEARILRHTVLRPNLSPEESVFPGDDEPTSLHLGAFERDELVGIATLIQAACPVDGRADDWRLRGMATVQQVRNRGIGGMLLSRCVAHVRAVGGDRVWCNGRSSARRFYERHGLKAVGEEFLSPHTGPHYLFVLELRAS
jgi:GNAT superfamily N-acetyltransferase